MSYIEKLNDYEKKRGHPIRVGLVGAGQMGSGLVSLIEKMVGIQIVIVADILLEQAEKAFLIAGVHKKEIVKIDNDIQKADKHIESGKRIITKNAQIIAKVSNLDIVVESTGVPEVGAKFCHESILEGKHVINMNVETDVVIGYYLNKLATASGVVYSLIAGDEPGAIKELFDFAKTLGFEVISIGKGKNNILDVNATPDTVIQLAKKKRMNPNMLASFVDGTKTMAELTSIANGTGYKPDIRGAHGPNVNVEDLSKTFIPVQDGGILSEKYMVDYAIGGNVAPGVFVVISSDSQKIRRDLEYLNAKYEYGKYWTLYRPYHLCNLEAPISILRAIFDKETTLSTKNAPVAELIAISKRDLKKGEIIDHLGGYTVYGTIDKAMIARKEKIVPVGIVVGAKIVRDIPKGNPIHYSDVELDMNQTIYHLRRLQDKSLGYQ